MCNAFAGGETKAARARLPVDETMDFVAFPPAATRPLEGAAGLLEALEETRERTLALVAGIADEDLERVHSPLMSPLVWDLGHIAAFEDLWLVHRFGGRPMLRRDLAAVYDAFETPRAHRGDLPYLRRAEALEYLAAVRDRVLDRAARHGIGDGLLHELVLRHELQHAETMLQTIQLARMEHYDCPGRVDPPDGPGGLTGLELVEVPGGPFELGAAAAGFAYDNERPRHVVEVPTFRIGRTPITNATFLRFAEGGGYERREWWSDEGWAWKEQYDITHPGAWTADGREWRLTDTEPLDPDRPVVHVSWFEADAFARAHGARLPTEAEWEKAATWDQETQTRRDPAGGNLGQVAYGTGPVGAFADDASPCGALGMLGDVWEWTASEFRGYPGFVARPYREYSEVFFGPDYRVLRGGSWATSPRVATASFRNWDYPQRRQIFSGLRIAADV
jgi:gamma-glutamyl hercynylcysteine S-oxide synthase